MTVHEKPRQLWIGTIEVRPVGVGNDLLDDARGAFVNIVTWANSVQTYRQRAELIVEALGGLFISEILNPEPVDIRRARIGGVFESEIEDMVSRAEANPNAIIYGTFHTFENDDA